MRALKLFVLYCASLARLAARQPNDVILYANISAGAWHLAEHGLEEWERRRKGRSS